MAEMERTVMTTRWKCRLLGALLMVLAPLASATVLAGRFDDLANAALVGSDLGGPEFANDDDVANNVALYAFSVPVTGVVSVQSAGYAAGGADPYFSLFLVSDIGTTFIDSNYAQAFSTGGDFLYSALLAAGRYRIALGAFANMSFAENAGSGGLAQGFIGLGQPDSLGDASYRLVLSVPTAESVVPEPATIWLFCLGLFAATGAPRPRPGSRADPRTLAGTRGSAFRE
jgi:hypothetical protein